MKHERKAKHSREQKPTATEAARHAKRKMAVDAVRQGEKPTVVARVLNVPRRTLFSWLELYRHGGYDALREGKRSGRPRKVNAGVLQWLYEAITLGEPRQYQFKFCLWTLGIIRAMLKRIQGIELSKSGVSRLLRHLGLSPQVPKYKSYRQDPRNCGAICVRLFLRWCAKPGESGRSFTLSMRRRCGPTPTEGRRGRRWERPRWWKTVAIGSVCD